MSVSNGAKFLSAIAGSAVSIYHFVVRASDSQYDHAGSAQIRVDGVAYEAQSTVGNVFSMAIPNGAIVKVEAGGSITEGGLVATNNAGEAIAWVDAAGNVALGRALEDADDGDIISIQFGPFTVGAGS